MSTEWLANPKAVSFLKAEQVGEGEEHLFRLRDRKSSMACTAQTASYFDFACKKTLLSVKNQV